MADSFEYRTLHVSLQSADSIVTFDSLASDPQIVASVRTPLISHLNSQDVARDGWEVCGFVLQQTQAIITLKRHKHN